jgi:Flp pilus assembly protein TadG
MRTLLKGVSRPATSRRGAQAIEFALTLPVLVVLAAGLVDVGQFLYVSERIASVASEGARHGAIADPDLGEDPLGFAAAAATEAWGATKLAGNVKVDVIVLGAAPDRRIEVTASVEAKPYFGFVQLLPESSIGVRTARLYHQE